MGGNKPGPRRCIRGYTDYLEIVLGQLSTAIADVVSLAVALKSNPSSIVDYGARRKMCASISKGEQYDQQNRRL